MLTTVKFLTAIIVGAGLGTAITVTLFWLVFFRDPRLADLGLAPPNQAFETAIKVSVVVFLFAGSCAMAAASLIRPPLRFFLWLPLVLSWVVCGFAFAIRYETNFTIASDLIASSAGLPIMAFHISMRLTRSLGSWARGRHPIATHSTSAP